MRSLFPSTTLTIYGMLILRLIDRSKRLHSRLVDASRPMRTVIALVYAVITFVIVGLWTDRILLSLLAGILTGIFMNHQPPRRF